RLDDPAVFERLRQLLALNAGNPGPERDIPGRRVLRLERADLLDRLVDRHRRAFEEQLTRQEGPVELSLRQGTGRSARPRAQRSAARKRKTGIAASKPSASRPTRSGDSTSRSASRFPNTRSFWRSRSAIGWSAG